MSRSIAESLPPDKKKYKNKLSLILSYGENNFDEAFEMLKNLDFSDLTYPECLTSLDIALQKEAWDFAIIIIEKLLEKKNIPVNKKKLLFELFDANVKLNRYVEIIKIGEQIYNEIFNKTASKNEEQESILWNMLVACLKRGESELSKDLLEKYRPSTTSFKFKVTIEVEVFLTNNEPLEALRTIVEGIKDKKGLSPC